MDRKKMETAVRHFLDAMDTGAAAFPGADVDRTPARVAQAWCEDLVSGYQLDPDAQMSWQPVENERGVVVVRNITFASVCIHHLLPFAGRAHVAYLPAARQAGLSKVGRVIDAHARRLQTQEHLTGSIADTLERTLEPRGVVVLLSAEHTCMTLRGVRKEQAQMATIESRGCYSTDAVERASLLSLLREGA